MTDPLSTQLPPAGNVPPSKKLKLDSVSDGDFLLEDLPDDLLVTNIDLPALDGPSTADFTNMPGLNSAQQPVPGLNSSLPPNSQPHPTSSMSQSLTQPPTSVNPAVPNPPPSSTPVALQNSNMGTLTTTAGASPNTTVISTSADPTPSLPNISSTSATPYPANAAMASVPLSAAMGTHPRMPSASTPFSYNSYGMTSSAPAINSQMNPMQPQQQQMINFVGGGGGVRHPSANPNMSRVPVNIAQQHGMMSQQPGMMQVRRPMMHHAPSMMPGHPQQGMGMHMVANRVQQMNPGMNMGGGMAHGHGGMTMHPNMHITTYNARTRMMEHTMMAKPGIHHHRMQGAPHQMQHHPMHAHGMNPIRQQMQGPVMAPQHHFSGNPSGYHSQVHPGFPMPMGQNPGVVPPPTHPVSSQMLPQQGMALATSNTATMPQQNMPSQQQQPHPPTEGVGQGSPLPGQLHVAGGPGPQLQVATPPQQQATPPQQQAQGVTAITQQPPPTSRPATPQQQHQPLNAPATPGSIQRGSPVTSQQVTPPAAPLQASLQQSPIPLQQPTPPPQQRQQPTPPQNTQSQIPLPPPQQPVSSASFLPQTSNSLALSTDSMHPFPGNRGQGGVQNQQQSMGSSPGRPGYINAGLSPAGQQGSTDPEKRKLIQQQLVLLLHAHKCQRREREHTMGGGGDYQPCSLPHCQTMKRVLNHMTECQAGRQCTYAHCASSRQIITHWKNCQKPDCPVCLPLKNAALPQNQTVRPNMPGSVGSPYSQPQANSPQMVASVQPPSRPIAPPNHMMRPLGHMIPGGPGGPGRPSLETLFASETAGSSSDMGDPANQSRVPFPLSIPNIPNQQTQPWHQLVQPELRQHLVRKLVETIYPIQNPNALQDQRVSSLIQYAMKVEKAMFETASSREQYYQLLAEKIYHIRKELEERRKIKLEMDKRRPMVDGLDSSIPNGGDGVGLSQGFFGSQRHSMASSPFSSQSPFPGHSNSPGASASLPDGNPSSLSSMDFLTGQVEDKKDGILPVTSAAKILSPTSAQPPSFSDLEGKGEIKSEIKSPPPSIRPPWSRPEAAPQPATPSEQKPIPSVHTPREPVPSVKARMGAENPPDSVPPSLPPSVPPSSRPTTPSKMDTGSIPTPSKYKVEADPSLRKVFARDEMVEALQPVLDVVYQQDPEAFPFREPVDPNSLGIPDYFDIIKNPMDLRTIRNRLQGGDYANPWEFCRDMRLMFDNAWVYNKKTSRVFKYCTKLSEVFDAHINTAMVKLGYCCGMRHTFHPQVLYCYGKSLCTIPRDGIYYGYQNRYIYCQKCFTELAGDRVTIGDDPTNTSDIPKSSFKEMKNDHVDYEPMVKCIHCGREFHTICVLYHAGIWNEGYQCDGCLKLKGNSRRENKFCAKRLPTNKLSQFLEKKVNLFLRRMDSGSEVIIRTVSSFDKVLDTRPLMRDRFQGDFPEQFPYRTKAMFVFEEIDGTEVCFFGLHVQEYGSDCQAPNTRRVYISYLDSIHFFHPKHLRTLVYHEILIGYLQFCKNNGFMTAHIWACPPSEGDDYIFHCHPVEQKIPKPKRLVEWYRKMLDRGKSDNVVYDYRDIFKHCTEDAVTSVTEIPYFEGDFWPNIIEDTIKELDQEAREREASEAATVEGRGTKKAGKRGTNKKGSKKAGGTRSKSGKASGMMIRGDDLSQKIYQTMEKHKEVFFVVLLQPPSVCSSPIASTVDPDQLIPCDLMDGRDAFLTMARERHWEFSSLRRAKASTQAMLYELHNQGANFIYSCNSCGRSVETRYHCRECDDFDLCLTCYDAAKHEHPMEKVGLGMIDPEDQDTTTEQDPQARKNASIQKAIESLIHASQCRNQHCKIPSCIRMRRILRHTRDCRQRAKGNNCQICKQFLFLVYSHAKNCKETNCPVGAICKRVKQNIQDTRAQQRRRNDLLMQQRIRSMQGMAAGSSSSTNGSSKPASGGSPANTSPPTSKAPPPTPPQKGSPAMHSSASPAGPRSVGKGGPRTPAGEIAGGKGGTQKMIAPSPAPSKPDRPMPAPNVTVNQVPNMGEAVIQKIPQPHILVSGAGQKEYEMANILLNGSQVDKEKVRQMLSQDPELQHRVFTVARQQHQARQQIKDMSVPSDMAPHQPAAFNTMRQPAMGMLNMRPPQQAAAYSHAHPQLMRAMPAQHYSPQMNTYRTNSSFQQPVHRMVGPQGQVFSQQQHQSPQLSRMLTQRQPMQSYQSPPNAYTQMTPQPHPVGPPPQYHSMHMPAQPQTAGYPHMLGHHPQQVQAHNAMQPVGPPMQPGHTHQFVTGPQTVPMDHGVPPDGNFVYNNQGSFSLNASNNNSNNLSQATYLTPEDRLSRLSELL